MISCNRCDHIWNIANCQNPQTCSLCGTKKGNVNPTNHTWTEATCKTPKTCSICGSTEGTISSSHTWTEATCKTPKTCSICELTEGTISSNHAFEGNKCKDCGCIKLTKWNFENYLDFSASTSCNMMYLTCFAECMGNPHYKYNDVKIVVKFFSYNNTEDFAGAMFQGEEVTYYDESTIILSLNLAGNGSDQCVLFFKNQNLISYSIESVSGTVQEY